MNTTNSNINSGLYKKYQGYDYSKVGTYTFGIEISNGKITKVEHLLPEYLKQLKGYFISVQSKSDSLYLGKINLSFNDSRDKIINVPLINSTKVTDQTTANAIECELLPNSHVQGYVQLNEGISKEDILKLTVYLHYTVSENKLTNPSK